MTWSRMDQMRAPDLQPLLPRITAQGKETRSYYPKEVLKRDQRRGLMLAVLFQAATDYHEARRIKELKQVKTEEDFQLLTDEQRQVVLSGKDAWEWFTQEPVGHRTGWTFKEICEHFGASPKRLWRKLKSSPDIKARLAYVRQAESDRPEPEIYISHKAKLDAEGVRRIREMAKTMTQTQIAKVEGVRQNTISRLIRGETWSHVK